MTQKEESEYIKLVPRFKKVCCSKMCDSWKNCKDNEDNSFLNCPWFFNYRLFGWPYIRLSYYSVNAPKLPDLRVEDIDYGNFEK